MKRMTLFFIAACFIMFSFISFPHDIVGLWQSKGLNNSHIYLDFKSDGSFKVTANGAIENEGHYKFNKDTFWMYDNNCGTTLSGKYKINFFTKDSASFEVIKDLCSDRKDEVSGGVIKRIKK